MRKLGCAPGCARGPTSAGPGGITAWLNSDSIRVFCATASQPIPPPSVSRSNTSRISQSQASWPDVRRSAAIWLVIGVAAVAAAVVYAGAGAVAHAVASLRIRGLLVLMLIHLPIVVL